jgi:hypothetical protein
MRPVLLTFLLLLLQLSQATEFLTISNQTVDDSSSWMTTTYLSAQFVLDPGRVRNTDPILTRLEHPDGRFALRRITLDVVDEDMNPVPQSEVYMHHALWLTEKLQGPCPSSLEEDIGVFLGFGAEYRFTHFELNAPYGTVFDGEDWYANFHLIRSSLVEDVKSCIECHCWDESGGSLICCSDEMRCRMDLSQPNVNTTKTYFIQYTVMYAYVDQDNVTLGGEQVIPVDTQLFDPANCTLLYTVPECGEPWPASLECRHYLNGTWVFDSDYEIVSVQPHTHIGGIRVEAFIIDGRTEEITELCIGYPRHGTQVGVPGNEKGYIVEIPSCIFTPETAVQVNQGDKLFVNSIYENSVYHDGAMGFVGLSMRKLI